MDFKARKTPAGFGFASLPPPPTPVSNPLSGRFFDSEVMMAAAGMQVW